MKITTEKLSAYLDGELSSAEMQTIEAALEVDSELATKFANLAEADAALTSAYKSLADEPIPDHILAMVHGEVDGDNVVLFAANNNVRGLTAKWYAPIAATLAMVIGFAIGNNLSMRSNASDELYAQLAGSYDQSSALFDIFEQTPSAQKVPISGSSNVSVEPLMTFETSQGTYCREIRIASSQSAQKGVVCRSDETWNVVLMTQDPDTPDLVGYRTASGVADNYIDSFIDDMITGIPLDLESEALIMKHDWTFLNIKTK